MKRAISILSTVLGLMFPQAAKTSRGAVSTVVRTLSSEAIDPKRAASDRLFLGVLAAEGLDGHVPFGRDRDRSPSREGERAAAIDALAGGVDARNAILTRNK
jgi:hypothetical protein